MSTDVESSNAQLQEMLELQLAEVEMLQSMFPNPGEFTLDSHSVLEELQAFVNGEISYDSLETRIGFTVKILTPESPLELVCNFPHEYPTILPEVFTRAPAMDRESHRHLKEDLHEFISSLETGQIIVGSVIEWLQENAHMYLKEDALNQDGKNGTSHQTPNKEESSFTRLWIYSHHIYSKFKRRDIVDWATELGLNGFSMPGKPGVICVEGTTEAVDEFWYRIRRLNWKRIMIKEQEVMELEGRKHSALCKFPKFQELDLEVHGGKGRNYHMDLGKFKEFLEEHNSAYMFVMYFGVEGKSAGD